MYADTAAEKSIAVFSLVFAIVGATNTISPKANSKGKAPDTIDFIVLKYLSILV